MRDILAMLSCGEEDEEIGRDLDKGIVLVPPDRAPEEIPAEQKKSE